MAAFNKFYCFVENIAEKAHNLGADTMKLLLSNSAPSASNTVKGDITEISTGNGYSAGGVALTLTSSSQTTGTYKYIVADATLQASGGSIGPFRYIVLYNDTSASDSLIGWWDYGSAVTLTDGEMITFDFDATNGVFYKS